MITDIKTNELGDIVFEDGDIVLWDGVAMAIRVRLKWFFGEWKLDTSLGVDWLTDVFGNPFDKNLIIALAREQIESVEEVEKVESITAEYDNKNRTARIDFTVKVSGNSYEGSVMLDV